MNIFKKAQGKLLLKKDLNIVIKYIKAGLKSKLDSVRKIGANKGVAVNFNDTVLVQASNLVDKIIKDIDEIRKHTEMHKKEAPRLRGAGYGAVLSPDEDYAIEMDSIRNIKKAGLTRPLTAEERNLLKEATKRFGVIYSEQIKTGRIREKFR